MNRISRIFAPPQFEDPEQHRQAGTLTLILWSVFFGAALTMLPSLVPWGEGSLNVIVLNGSAALLAVGGLRLIRRGNLRLLSWVVSIVLYFLIFYAVYTFGGVTSTLYSAFIVSVLIAGMLLGRNVGYVFTALSLLAGVLLMLVDDRLPENLPPTPFTAWSTAAVVIVIAFAILARATENLRQALHAATLANRDLETLRASLQTEITARTRDLAVAAEIGQTVSSRHELADLLIQTVELVRERFDLYYVQVYLTDPAGTKLILRAGTGQAGAELVRRGHSLAVGPGSINGIAAAEGTPLLVPDVTRNPNYRPNPLLPETRSQAAIPLIIRDGLVGVLNLQGDRHGQFTAENLPAYQTLAGQIASAIENAALFARAEENRLAAETAARRLERAGWEEFLSDTPSQPGYTYTADSLQPARPDEDPDPAAEATPITLLGETVGSLQLEWEGGAAPEGARDLAAAVAQQVASQIENLRLLAQAERYRLRAEEAVRRLTRQSWAEYLASIEAQNPGFSYESGEIKPLPRHAALSGALQLPISVRGQTIGALAVDDPDLDENDFELAAIISGRLSAHIENIRLFRETEARQLEIESRRRDLEASQRVTFAAAESQSPAQLLNLVVNLIRDQFKLYHVQVYLVDEARSAAVLRESTGYAGTQLLQRGHRIALDQPALVTRAIQNAEPVLVADVRAEPGFLPNPLLPDTRAELVLPLRGSETVFGVLDVQSAQTGYFTPDTLNLFRTMAEQVALIIERAQTSEALARTLAVAEVLYAGSDRIVRSQSIEQVLNSLVGSTSLQTLGRAGILLFDKPWHAEPPAEMVLEAVWEFGDPSGGGAGTRYPLGGQPLSGMLSPREPLVIPDFDLQPAQADAVRRMFGQPAVRGMILFPMVIAGDWIGLLIGQSLEPIRLSAEEIRQVDSLTDQAAAVIQSQRLLAENVRALAETEEQARRLAALNAFSAALGAAGTLREALDLAARKMGEVITVDRASIAWLDDEAGLFEVYALRGESGAVPAGAQLPLSGTAVGQAAATRQPVVTPDLSRSKYLDSLELAAAGLRSTVVAPLLAAGGVLGTLNVASYVEDDFSANEINVIAQAASLLAAAIENRRLFEQTERRATELETVSQVSASASTSLDTNELLRSFVELSRERFGLSHVQIFLADETGIWLSLAAASGGRALPAAGRRIALNEEGNIIAAAAFRREGQIVNEVQRETGAQPSLLLPSTRSQMALPLLAADQVLGVLDLQSEHANRFSDEDLRIHTTLASQVAVALQNARLFEELRQTAERLQEVDRLKSEFLANMSHELRTPLNSVIGYAEIILMGIEGEVSDSIREDVEAIFNNGQHLLRLINDVLDLAKIESGRMTLSIEYVDLAGLVEEVRMNNIGMILKAKKPLQIVTDLAEDLPPIQADRVRVSQILNNLVSNAVKFSDAGDIIVRVFREDGEVCIEVEDHGIGIASDAMGRVFEKFTQVDGSTTRQAEGTGLGLPISRHLAEMHGGQLSARSELGAGSTFTVRLPISGRKAEGAPPAE